MIKKNLLIYLIISLNESKNCKLNQYMEFNKNSNDIDCINCSENCIDCHKDSSNTIICNICNTGYHLKDNICVKCYKNCNNCVGPSINDCIALESGYFYNIKNKDTEKCPESCLECNLNKKCIFCNNSYFSIKEILNDNSREQICEKCDLLNCESCEYKNSEIGINKIKSCSFCNKGYGISNGKCLKCKDNCNYCYTDINKCSYCKEGYYLDPKDQSCQPIKVNNCMNFYNNLCAVCYNGYYVNEKNECSIIQKEVINCEYGNYNKNSKQFKCNNCIRGYYLSSSNNTCLNCSDNCDYCSEFTCNICNKGYVLINKKCEVCNIDKCLTCNNISSCSICEYGYYFENKTKKCEKCHDNCSECNGPDHKNCLSCSFNKFKLENEKIIHNDIKLNKEFKNNFLLNLFFGGILNNLKNANQVVIEISCYSECPKVLNEKEILVDYNKKLCIVDKKASASEIDLPVIEKTKDMYHQITKLYTNYKKEINNTIENSTEKNGQSKECHFNGIIKKIFNSYKENYFICYCDDYFIGDNCEIKIALYKKVNLQLIEILNIIKGNINYNKKNINFELEVLSNMFNFKLSKSVIISILNIIDVFIKNDKDLENRKKLYVILDSMILSSFDLLEDMKRKNNLENIFDFEKINEKKDIFQVINRIRNIILECFSNYNLSFLKKMEMSNFNLYNLYSYEIMEYSINNKRHYQIKNSYIDSVSRHTRSNIHLKFIPNQKSDYNLQLICFSNELFSNLFENKKKKFSTNLIQARLVNEHNHITKNLNFLKKSKFIEISFYLRELPTIPDLRKILFCSKLTKSNKIKIVGIIDKINDGTKRISCIFDTSKIDKDDLLVVIENDLSENYVENNYIKDLYKRYKLFKNSFIINILFMSYINLI